MIGVKGWTLTGGQRKMFGAGKGERGVGKWALYELQTIDCISTDENVVQWLVLGKERTR